MVGLDGRTTRAGCRAVVSLASGRVSSRGVLPDDVAIAAPRGNVHPRTYERIHGTVVVVTSAVCSRRAAGRLSFSQTRRRRHLLISMTMSTSWKPGSS